MADYYGMIIAFSFLLLLLLPLLLLLALLDLVGSVLCSEVGLKVNEGTSEGFKLSEGPVEIEGVTLGIEVGASLITFGALAFFNFL